MESLKPTLKMSDVAQILGLAGPSSGGGGPATAAEVAAKELDGLKAKPVKPAKKPKKLTGMQREVLELLESHHRAHHSLYPGHGGGSGGPGGLSLQQRWRERRGRPAAAWVRRSFTNPARAGLAGEGGNADGANNSDADAGGLQLTHWVKRDAPAPAEYAFARFNVSCAEAVISYTDDEYDEAIATHADPAMKWTREETDALLGLCRRHDLRWIVIADKYNTHPVTRQGQNRSVEDIKYRYYEIARLLGEYRDRQKHKAAVAAAAAATSTATPAAASASPATTTADDGIKEEGGKPVAIKTEGGDVKTTTASTTTTPSASPSTTTAATARSPPPPPAPTTQYYRFNLAYERQRKRQLDLAFTRSTDEDLEIKRLQDELRVVEQQLKKAAIKVDPKKKRELLDGAYSIQRELPKGAILRSATLALPPPSQPKAPTLSSKLLKKMEVMLDEMGVPARPMPTKLVCEAYDALRQEVIGLLSLRKHLATRNAEVQALKDRYQTLTGKEYKPITPALPVRKTSRRGENGAATGTSGNGSSGDAATPATISKGKALKTAEKQFRASSKRRGSGTTPGAASKRNKKNL